MAIELVSRSAEGTIGDNDSFRPSISSDGSYVAFDSDASNLVSGDTNGTLDVFVYDRGTNNIELVSRSTAGVLGNSASSDPSISSDGRFVAFYSAASNLVSGDTNGADDVFIYNRDTDNIELVSRSTAGVLGNFSSLNPSISSDGRYIAFDSFATNLVSGDTNNRADVFVYDRDTDSIGLASRSTTGILGDDFSVFPSISSDGRLVAFHSSATNLVPDDTNSSIDIFVYDRDTNSIELVSRSTAGVLGNSRSRFPSISNDGRFVAFSSDASNLVSGDTNGVSDTFVYDRDTDSIELVSRSTVGVLGNNDSEFPSISSDGRYVAFDSFATNLVSGDTNGFSDTFVYDRDTDSIELVSRSTVGIIGDSDSFSPSISSDGSYVALEADATNLVSGDTNGKQDVFVVSRLLTEESPNIKLIQIGGTTRTFEDYATDTYQFILTAKPLSDVTLSLTADETLTVEPATLTFTPENFNTIQLVTVTGQSDSSISSTDRTLNITTDIKSLDTNYEILTIDPVTVQLTDTDNISNEPTQSLTKARVLSPDTDVITAIDTGSFVLGKAGNDVLLGQAGQDKLFGGDGDDYLSGGDEHDYLNGNAGDDLLEGGDNFDVIYGSDGNDILNGDGGNDSLFGGRGEDELFGGAGDDTLTGGFDADVFVLGKNRGVDTFEDFSAGFDQMNLIDGLAFSDLTIEQADTTTESRILETATGDVLAVLSSTPFNTISETDFF